MTETSESIRRAAFRLFDEQSYDTTTVDQIVQAAGVSSSTFFRMFGSKEAVIFPDHDRLLSLVEERLQASSSGSALVAVTDAVKVVLFHYISEGERARERYRLTSSVVALRERELASSARYQRLFRRYLSSWGDESEAAEQRAELMSAAVVAAHNRVLRRWLRSECDDPHREIADALTMVHRMFDAGTDADSTIFVVHTTASATAVHDALRQALESIQS